MFTCNKVYIWLSKITHLSLHSLLSLFNLKNAIHVIYIHMTNFDLKEKEFQISDPIENYFECISSCDVKDGSCISMCVEILKNHDN